MIQHDEEMERLAKESETNGQVIRYVGLVDMVHSAASVTISR